MKRKTLPKAVAEEIEFSDRRLVSIQAEDWEMFEAWANEPPKEIPALKRLALLGRKAGAKPAF